MIVCDTHKPPAYGIGTALYVVFARGGEAKPVALRKVHVIVRKPIPKVVG